MKYHFQDFSDDMNKVLITKSIFIPTDMVMHSHDFCEIVYVKSGNGTHILNNSTSAVKKGDLIIVSCADTHTFRDGNRNFIWYNCIFLPTVFNRIFKISDSAGYGADKLNIIRDELCMVKHRHPLILSKCEKIEHLFDELYKNQYSSKEEENSILYMLLSILLVKITELISTRNQYDNTYSATDLLNMVYSYFHGSSAYPKVKLNDVAEKAHMEPTAFSKLFRKKVGCGFSEVIQKIRFDKAAYLLETSDMSVNEIKKYVGYEDTKYFFESFKKRFSTTPQEYRKQIAAKNNSSTKPS